MYENLTMDDIINVWSDVMLDRSIRGLAWNDPKAPIDVHARLMLENERRRPFTSITQT